MEEQTRHLGLGLLEELLTEPDKVIIWDGDCVNCSQVSKTWDTPAWVAVFEQRQVTAPTTG